MADDIPMNTLAQSENYVVWTSDEPDGEMVFHVELGSVTLHLFQEEWDEMVGLIQAARKSAKE